MFRFLIDGKVDLVVSGILNDSFFLFRNLAAQKGFEDYAQPTGLTMSTRQLTGWSLEMYDFDNDVWKDLFFALAHLMQPDRYLGRDAALPNRIYRNLEGQASGGCVTVRRPGISSRRRRPPRRRVRGLR